MNDISYPYEDPHRQTQRLLPWYVSGAIDPDDTAMVEAHLADCVECRSDLGWERALAREMSAMRTGEGRDWAVPRDRLQEPASPRRPRPARRALPGLFRKPVAVGWALAAQAASLILMAGLFAATSPHPAARYVALGAAPAVATGNILVMFNPTTSEADLRAALLKSETRLVDGPTASGAYLLHAAANARGGAIKKLRSEQGVVMAEPLDAPP